MAVKKTIAIIGATGRLGSAITRILAKGPYRLLLCSRHIDALHQQMLELEKESPAVDMEQADCAFEAVWEADIIIPAVPPESEKEVADTIKMVSTQKIVIRIEEGEEKEINIGYHDHLQDLLPYSKLVKIQNPLGPGEWENPVHKRTGKEVAINGDDEEALDIVSQILVTAGFTPVISQN